MRISRECYICDSSLGSPEGMEGFCTQIAMVPTTTFFGHVVSLPRRKCGDRREETQRIFRGFRGWRSSPWKNPCVPSFKSCRRCMVPLPWLTLMFHNQRWLTLRMSQQPKRLDVATRIWFTLSFDGKVLLHDNGTMLRKSLHCTFLWETWPSCLGFQAAEEAADEALG